MNFTGEFEQALAAVQKPMKLPPRNANSYLTVEGFAYQGAGRYGDALAAFKSRGDLSWFLNRPPVPRY
jgi:hypothetical protein